MRFLKLVVDAFVCIEHADVDFGPGLNVLYGPNDLGKSSLVEAMRYVLLLPHGSAAHEDLISWHGGGQPQVALTFSTEPQRVWRVTKTFGFGSAGSSLLEFSKDGGQAAWTGDRWKLVKPGPNRVELYDLLADPAEAKDVAAAEPAVVASLKAELDAWQASVLKSYRGGDY